MLPFSRASERRTVGRCADGKHAIVDAESVRVRSPNDRNAAACVVSAELELAVVGITLEPPFPLPIGKQRHARPDGIAQITARRDAGKRIGGLLPARTEGLHLEARQEA